MSARGKHGLPQSIAIYVHIPFCLHKCGYCDFNSYPTEGTSEIDRFLDGLHAELNLVPLPETPISVFFGGGTPTYLEVDQMRALHDHVTRHFEIEPDAEAAIEVDPRVTTHEQVDLLREMGRGLGDSSGHRGLNATATALRTNFETRLDKIARGDVPRFTATAIGTCAL